MTFKEQILLGLPSTLPPKRTYPKGGNPAPRRKALLSIEEKKLALRNALRYFPPEWHVELAAEFAAELEETGRIYMYRFKPSYPMHARPLAA